MSGASRTEPCRRIVTIGASPTPWVRCGLPEDSPMHDPLGPTGRHVYDPAPVLDEDEVNAPAPVEGDEQP